MNETFDFVVVGSGGGSMCAALVLRKAGKSVLVLEKADLVGGTTGVSGGVMWIPNNRFMKEAGVPDSREQAIAYLDAVVGDHPERPGASRERRAAYVDEGTRMVDFLVEQGVGLQRISSWPDYRAAPGESVPGRTVTSKLFDLKLLSAEWKAKLPPGFLPLAANLEEALQLPLMSRSWKAKKVLARVILRTIGSKLRGQDLATAGLALQASMLHAALKAGAEIRTGSAVKQLIVEQDRVTGVVTESKGAAQHIGARLGVLINAGGFGHNQRMLDQYMPGISTDWSLSSPGNTGELIEDAIRAGAAVAQMEQRMGMPIAILPGEPPVKAAMQGDLAKPHTIVVDQSAQRYLKEACSYMDFCLAMQARQKTAPAIPSWMILDSQYMAKYMLCGTMPGSKKPQAWFDSGFLKQAATVEELATVCGLDRAALRSTIDRYNGFVRQNRDEDFNRGSRVYDNWLGDPLHTPSQTLGSIEKGPFFALKIYPGDVGTYGGLVTDAKARVLKVDGSAITGLYATGISTASVMGADAPGAGASVGPSFVWGYVAARHATQAA